jgi:hypothetical protein
LNHKTTHKSPASFGLESLEGRQLLSASLVSHHAHAVLAARHESKGSAITSSPTNSGGGSHKSTIGSVGSVGQFQIIQFQNAPSVVQTALQANAPTGVTIAATQNVVEQTTKTTTLYTVSLNNAGTRTTITVNSSGTLITLDTNTTIQFSAAPAAVQAGMQALAPSGVTIAATQNVTVNTINGVTRYSAIVVYGPKQGFLQRAKLIVVNSEGDPIGGGTSAV